MSELQALNLLWHLEQPWRNLSNPEHQLLERAAIEAWGRHYGLQMIRKVLAWEYHLWVKSGASHASFIAALTTGTLSNTVEAKYPTLASLYRQQLIYLHQQVDLLASRIERDRNELGLLIADGRELGPLTAVQWGIGDSHNGGQQVHALEFSGHKIVYKPRSLEAETRFQDYLIWLNQALAEDFFKILRTSDLESYGWCEFIEHQYADGDVQLRAYYERFGGLLAVLFSLGAVDFHYENLIAHGAHPVLIDLESCVQPQRLRSSNQELIDPSVLETAMLPSRLWNFSTNTWLDVGAVSAKAGDLLPEPEELLSGFDGGPLRLQKVIRRSTRAKNRPERLQRSPWHWHDAIVAGFSRIYRTIMEHRDWLTESVNSPVTALSNTCMRFLPRNTYTYAKLLRESFHPKLLQDLPAWRAHWQWLQRFSAATDLPVTLGIYEAASLQRGDIPYFQVEGRSGDLAAGVKGSYDHTWTGVFGRSPAANVNYRLRLKLSEQDLQRQQWFITTSLCLLANESQSHRLVLADTEHLIELLAVLGGSLGSSDPYWLTTRLASLAGEAVASELQEAAISRLGKGLDGNEIAGIETALRYSLIVHPSTQIEALLGAHRNWAKRLPTECTNSTFSVVEAPLQFSLDSHRVDLAWIRGIDELLDSSSDAVMLDALFRKPVEFSFATPRGVMTSDFTRGIAGLLYLSCRYHRRDLPSILRMSQTPPAAIPFSAAVAN